MGSTRRAAAAKPPTRPVVERFSMRDRRAVGTYLELEPEHPAVTSTLAVMRETGLSVFTGQLFVIDQKVPSRNAEGLYEEVWVKRPAAGRDGFLRVAHRSGVFAGLQGDVVCANDGFDVDWGMDSDAPLVRHRHAAIRAGASAREAREYRGPIIGAWAKGYRRDMVPFFYFAHLTEHGRSITVDGTTEWIGAWDYTSAMILKCAMSYVLRILFSITGVVPADELRNDPKAGQEDTVLAVTQVLDVGDAIPKDGDPGVRERLLAAVEAANEAEPGLWPAAKCEMVFGRRSDVELEKLTVDIARGTAALLARREQARVMPSADEPATPERLRELLADARARASAAQTDKDYVAASEDAERIERQLADSGEPDHDVP